MMGETGTATRFVTLDAVRGVAVMGILAMNIAAFALPLSAYFNPMAGGSASSADIATWGFNFVLIDSKMRGLFSMLFGASTLLVIERATQSGRSAAKIHYSRMFWLLIFGLLHFYLIWFGDILTLYAACGALLYFFRDLSIRALLWWAGGFFLVGMVYQGMGWGLFASFEAGILPDDMQKEFGEAWAEISGAFGPANTVYASDLTQMRGSYGSIVAERIGTHRSDPVVQMLQSGWETMALMLIGMALFKSQMFTGGWELARYRAWALRCFLIAVPPLAALVWYQVASGYSVPAVFGASIVFSAPFDFVLTVGWAALIIYAIQQMRAGWVARLAATGQMAFTNYLTTSVVMTSIFYGYGLGLFGAVSRPGLYLFCIGMWAAMLLCSKPWLDRFHYGPMEWLWRSLSRMELQLLRK